MNIAIRVDASKKIGTGHFERCLTLANQLNPFCSKIIFICRHLFDHLKNTLIKNGYQCVILNSPQNRHSYPENFHSHWLGVSQKQDALDCREILSENLWDWIVVDHYALDYSWESLLRNISRKILVIDDLADRKHNCDLLLDQNFYKNKEIRYSKKIPTNCKMLLGPKYALLRKEFNYFHSKVKLRAEKPEKLLVFFGGVDSHNYTVKIIDILCKISIFKFSVDVIIGSNHPKKSEIISKCRLFNFTCHVQTNRMAELLSEADIAIGAGGTVTWERICCLLPSIVITTAENQILPMKELADVGIIYYLGHKCQDIEGVITNAIRGIISGKFNKKFIFDKKIIEVDGLGAKRVTNILIQKE